DALMPVKGNKPLDINPEHLALVRRGMFEVVNSGRGTARGSKIRTKGMEMAGKTGTSQVRRITKEERAKGVTRNEDLPWNRRDHALFVAFAPYDNPQYALSVIVEHGGGGSRAAAPIARDIMLAALEREKTGYGKLPSQKRRTGDPDEKAPRTRTKPRDRA
ncbi:MAG: penicillin-binding protein 2, partial [Proteobacteria bacterium]|nr:penicillin-binding protein 2 [Pseudomonadota bacterium]